VWDGVERYSVLVGSAPFRSRPAGKYRERSWLTSQFELLPPNVPESLLWRALQDVPRYLRPEIDAGGSGCRTTINAVPIYEFVCESCGHRFEELVGSHVDRDAAEVACPECGSAEVERQVSSSYAPLQRQLTANQKRRLEDKRGTDRGGAKERFKRQRAAERSAARRRGSS
jgi:putative FmdB family regulatory protein